MNSRSRALLPPAIGDSNIKITQNNSIATKAEEEASSTPEYYFQVGYRTNEDYIDTEIIPLNGSIAENVWHGISLIVDKDSTSNVQLFFDEKFVGRFSENLPPRDIGGVLVVNTEENDENKALFKNFVIGRCLQFNSVGECKHCLESLRYVEKITFYYFPD